MTVQSVLEDTKKFLDHLGLSEEPFGVYYDNTKPENAFGPKPGIPMSRELEDQGKADMQEAFKLFSNLEREWIKVRKKITRSAQAWGESE
jgi:hypothetical protein